MMRLPLLVLCVLLLCASDGFGQRGRDRGPRGRRPRGQQRLPFGPGQVLLSLPEIQNDLELSRQQTKLIEALEGDVLSQLRSRSLGNVRINDRENSRQREVLAKLRRTIFEDNQASRFRQLILQFEGLYAIEDEEFAKKLQLTDAQRTRIRRVRRASDPLNALERVESIIADEQLDLWQESLGREFDFSDAVMDYRVEYLRNFGSQRPQ